MVPLRLLDGASALGASAPSVPGAVFDDTSIGNFFVFDQRIKRRRPITREEFALLRQFVEVRDRVKRKYLREQRELRALASEFTRHLGFRHVDSYQGVRLPYAGDYAGLIPVKRREPARNRAESRATLARHGQNRIGAQRAQAGNGRRLRQPVRVHPARSARV